MMGQSNDWFYGPNESGIELFKDSHPSAETSLRKSFFGMSAPKWIRNLESDRTRGRDKKDLTPGKPKTGWFERLKMARLIRGLPM
jgi:hypothetical protein